VNILSFTDWVGSHDTAAALVCDGVLVAAAEEERFSRRKHDGSTPVRAIEFCLRQAGLRMADVDLIAFPGRPFRSGRHSEMMDASWGFLRQLRRAGALRRRAFVHRAFLSAYRRLPVRTPLDKTMSRPVRDGLGRLREHFGHLPPMRFYDHHQAHAAAAFFTSGLDRAAVATIDGRGGLYSTVTWRASGGKIQRIRAEPWLNSLGIFYEHCSVHLGLGNFGQGKVMGLAPYGDANRAADRMSRVFDVSAKPWYRIVHQPLESAFGFTRRTTESVLAPPYTDFAAAVQRSLESAVRRVVESAQRESGIADVCLGGGVSLNCSSNGALLASGVANSLSLFPAAGDNGLPVGAALMAAFEAGEYLPQRISHAYLGPEFSDDECEQALVRALGDAFSFARVADVAAETARLLAAGAVVGWFQGRMELGPRALGNRSILADPRSTDIRDRVNRIKRRELWRPLAPSVLAERAAEYFHLVGTSPFMLLAVPVRSEKRAAVPAITHVDGSARPQTVTRDQNRRYHDLIAAFERETGVPMVLNTSFNDASEPIVCTPDDALRTFLATDLDALVLGSSIAVKLRRDVRHAAIEQRRVEVGEPAHHGGGTE
jgi:carbamoyltransferase